jgi:hypothetical protein
VSRRDKRSFRVALVADRYLNPPARGLDVIPILLEADWGVIQLPADAYPREVAGALLEQVAEQTEEFHRHGYDVVVIGRRTGLKEALAAAGVPRLDQLDPVSAGALQSFLHGRPSPRAGRAPKRTARATVKKA